MARRQTPGLLRGARVYLSGPMDFVASRANEQKFGWRNRVGDFLRELGVTVFDPWTKPRVRGMYEYGREGVDTSGVRDRWTFKRGRKGAEARAWCAGRFWETLHIDLRMVDTSDFTIAYCPTNIYSVGTPHEIIVSRQEHKPVLFVSPPVRFEVLGRLRAHLKGDAAGLGLVDALAEQVPVIENPRGTPSSWYMPLVGPDSFFDGFGFAPYVKRFRWQPIPLDEHEANYTIRNPLLPFLERLNRQLPKKWDNRRKRFVRNDDWLLWKLPARPGA
jgi:hypothetical protein